ncbi:hypothetical protein PG984_010956 [Apiospora sp. TS-2023a]
MFFSGTLQEGISKALEKTKNVVCFVTDEGEESQQWEEEFLAETTVQSALDDYAVALRLKAGSEEAGYLEALFPVPRKPTLIVIQNGQLREYIASGTSKDEFTKRLQNALGSSAPQTAPIGSTASSASAPLNSSQPAAGTDGNLSDDHPPPVYGNDDDLYDDPPPAASSSRQPPTAPPAPVVSTPSSSGEREAEVQSTVSEQAKLLEAEKQAKEKAAKAEREKRAKERQDAAPTGDEGQSSNPTAAMSSYAQMMRQKRQEAKEERQRILQRIEDDKRARREREAEEKKARLLLATANPDAAASTTNAAAGPPIPLPTRGTLGKEVRQWIDEKRTDGTDPYMFRIVLTPLPNKAIEPAEESDMLRDLGLAPSATLILMPVVRVATAYEQGGGLLLRGWSYLYALIAMLFSPFAMLFRGRNNAHHDASHENIPLDDLDVDGSSRQRFRGFRNPDDERRDHQLYNGNSLNFEPRRDDEGSDT